MLSFFKSIRMPQSEFQHPVEDINQLIHGRADISGGLWQSVGCFFRNFSNIRGFDRIVLLFGNIDALGKTELNEYRTLTKELANLPIKIFTTSHTPLRQYDFVIDEVEVKRLSSAECQEAIHSVFIYPEVQEEFQKALIARSEKNPSNLKSLLKSILTQKEELLDFDHPLGTTVKDWNRFNKLPVSLGKTLEMQARNLDVLPEIVACIACLREPVSKEVIEKILNKLDKDFAGADLGTNLQHMKKNGWLVPKGNNFFQLESAAKREALLRVVPEETMEQIHKSVFLTYKMEERDDPIFLIEHLMAAPISLIAEHQASFLQTIQILMGNGEYGMVKRAISRLDGPIEAIQIGFQAEIDIIEQELRWIATGDLHTDSLNSLRKRLDLIKDKQKRRALRIRIVNLECTYRNENKKDYKETLELVEQANRNILFGFQRIHNADLEFDYYLNLWELYYRTFNEKRFLRIDRRIWKNLQTGDNTDQIAKFLSLFLKLCGKFPDDRKRKEYFPVSMIEIGRETRPVRDNAIEVATRVERIRDSFLNDFLESPDKLDLKNRLMIGRLFLGAGVRKWQALPDDEKYSDENSSVPTGSARESVLRAYF